MEPVYTISSSIESYESLFLASIGLVNKDFVRFSLTNSSHDQKATVLLAYACTSACVIGGSSLRVDYCEII